MNKLKNTLIITLISVVSVAVVLVGFSVLTYNANIKRLNNGEEPSFIFRTDDMLDGGSKIYYGLGFHVIKWHSFIENTALDINDFGEHAEKNAVYVCGWDIGRGNDRDTVKSGPSPEHTIDFRLEQ